MGKVELPPQKKRVGAKRSELEQLKKELKRRTGFWIRNWKEEKESRFQMKTEKKKAEKEELRLASLVKDSKIKEKEKKVERKGLKSTNLARNSTRTRLSNP